ncbi:MAG: hypothetical protein WC373_12705 [Smithella sp.]|jgi:hypothetical protein
MKTKITPLPESPKRPEDILENIKSESAKSFVKGADAFINSLPNFVKQVNGAMNELSSKK